MANSLKRMSWAEEAGFQKQVAYYFWEKAKEVLAEETPNSVELAFAKKVYAGQVLKLDMCLTVITNTSIGSTIDSSGSPSDSDVEWAVKTDNQFGKLALAYEAAGLISAGGD